MKKLFKSSVILLAATALFASCQPEELQPQDPETFTLTVNATAEDAANAADTKTYIDGKQVYWHDTEQMALVLFDGDGANARDVESDGFKPSKDKKTGTYTFSLTGEGTTNISGVYPASAFVECKNNLASTTSIELSSIQGASKSSYDPAAFIMITQAQQASLSAEPQEINAYYKRVTALNKFSLKNFNDNITQVRITFPESYKGVVGRKYFNLLTGEYANSVLSKESNIVTVNYKETIAASEVTKDIWFNTWGFYVAADAEVKVEVIYETDTQIKTYTKTFSSAKQLDFKVGYLNSLNLDMSGITPTTKTKVDYSANYLIIGQKSGIWYVMDGDNTGNKNHAAIATDISAETFSGIPISDFHSVYGIGDNIWTVKKQSDGGYTFKNAENYLKLNGTSIQTSAEPVSLYIEEKDDMSFLVKASQSDVNWIQLLNSGTAVFKTYNSNQLPIYLYKWEDPASPIIVAETATKDVEYDTENVEFNYSTLKVTGGVSVAKTSDADNIILGTPSAVGGVVSIDLKPNTENKAKTATVTLSYSGAKSVVLTINQAAKPNPNAKGYVKVTSAPANWAGSYLIVYEASNEEAIIHDGRDGLDLYTTAAITNGKIAKTAAVDACLATVAVVDGGYSIFIGGKYMGQTSDANGTQFQDTALTNTIVLDTDGSIKISSAGAVLRYNSASNQKRFRYYKSSTYTGQKAVHFYKMEE